MANHTPLSADFPADAAAALGSMELSLPPLPEPADDAEQANTTGFDDGGGALYPDFVPETEPPHDAPATAPEAEPKPIDTAGSSTGATGSGVSAGTGLGAAPFGRLNLDFDLDLPPSPGQAVAPMSAEELTVVARNKLDLAIEYMALGDLAGARALVNEVLESNDAATLDQARELRAALLPL
jgi:FimV-like protein